MFLFSDAPDGRTADDPFEYYKGGKWVKIVQPPEMIEMMKNSLTKTKKTKPVR